MLATKEPALVAATVHELLLDADRLAAVVAAGRRQAARYTLDAARTAFRSAIDEAIERA